MKNGGEIQAMEKQTSPVYTPWNEQFAPENRPSQKEMIVFQPSIFRCELAASFREGKS